MENFFSTNIHMSTPTNTVKKSSIGQKALTLYTKIPNHIKPLIIYRYNQNSSSINQHYHAIYTLK